MAQLAVLKTIPLIVCIVQVRKLRPERVVVHPETHERGQDAA